MLRRSSPLAKMIKNMRMFLIVILAAGVLEGRGEGGVVARVGDRELVIELSHVGHDEELVGRLAPHDIVHIQQLRNTKLRLSQAEGQQTVAESKKFHCSNCQLDCILNAVA